MKQKKIIISICIFFSIVLMAITVLFLLQDKKENLGEMIQSESKTGTLAQVKSAFRSDLQKLKDGNYANLLYHEFEASIEDVEGLYHLEILMDESYQERTNLENFKIMNKVIDKFFKKDIDKSYLKVDLYLSNTESIEIAFEDVEEVFSDEQYKDCSIGFLYGEPENENSEVKFIQILPSLQHTWFSKNSFGDIVGNDYDEVYPYVSCIRQKDTILQLRDGEIKLSDMEEKVLEYLNGEEFPLPKSEGIRYGIGKACVKKDGEFDALTFKVRRIYKGLPFEYGSSGSSGMYNDAFDHDSGELCYAESSSPAILRTFGRVNGTVVETKEITEFLTVGNALEILSQKVGENSIYDVYGVELVYRDVGITDEQFSRGFDAIVAPKWKIITINQNDNKYTLFYIDVVTGEITERFDYLISEAV